MISQILEIFPISCLDINKHLCSKIFTISIIISSKHLETFRIWWQQNLKTITGQHLNLVRYTGVYCKIQLSYIFEKVPDKH